MHDAAEVVFKKYDMGTTIHRVSLDKLPLTSHAFATLDGRRFKVRSRNYEATGEKVNSESSMGEVLGVDIFRTDHKVPHIMKYINIPDEFMRPSSCEGDFQPRLLIVNFMIPDYAPSNPVWGKSKIDGKGYSMVFYILVKNKFDDAKCKAESLLKRFLAMNCESDDDFDLRARLKGIPILLNPEMANVGMPMRQLIKKYNGKPFLTGPKYHYYVKTDCYLECDVDVHQWIYPARKALHTLLPDIAKLEIDFGFVIEGHGEENPERMLCSIRLRHINPGNAVHIPARHELLIV